MRKRSSRVTPAILGSIMSLAILTSCGEEEEPQVDASLFETVAQCASSGEYTQADCEKYFNEAKAAHVEAAPKYGNQADCEAEFGPGKCEQGPELSADASASGSDGSSTAVRHHSYVPLAAGILVGAAVAQPLYRMYQNKAYGSYMTSSGSTVGSSIGKTRVYSSVATTRPTRSTTTMSRGGFGSMSRSASS